MGNPFYRILRLSKWWLLLLIPLIAFGGCYLLLKSVSFDNTEKITHAVLFDPKGGIDVNAFGAILNQRFPTGSPTRGLRVFVASIGGYCEERASDGLSCGGPKEYLPVNCATQKLDHLYCDLPVAGSICVENALGIESVIGPNNTLSPITVRWNFKAC